MSSSGWTRMASIIPAMPPALANIVLDADDDMMLLSFIYIYCIHVIECCCVYDTYICVVLPMTSDRIVTL